MDAEDAVTIGQRLRLVRHAKGKSLAVVAGLAGITSSQLRRLESGERAAARSMPSVTSRLWGFRSGGSVFMRAILSVPLRPHES